MARHAVKLTAEIKGEELKELIRLGYEAKYGHKTESVDVTVETRCEGYGAMEHDAHYASATICLDPSVVSWPNPPSAS